MEREERGEGRAGSKAREEERHVLGREESRGRKKGKKRTRKERVKGKERREVRKREGKDKGCEERGRKSSSCMAKKCRKMWISPTIEFWGLLYSPLHPSWPNLVRVVKPVVCYLTGIHYHPFGLKNCQNTGTVILTKFWILGAPITTHSPMRAKFGVWRCTQGLCLAKFCLNQYILSTLHGLPLPLPGIYILKFSEIDSFGAPYPHPCTNRVKFGVEESVNSWTSPCQFHLISVGWETSKWPSV